MRLSRTLYAAIGSAGLLAVTAGQTLAFDCTVANKPTGAGSAGTVTIDVTNPNQQPVLVPTKNNAGTTSQPHGGFATVTLTAGTQTLGTFDTFVHAPQKSQAPFAEPGVNPGATKQTLQGRGCDGKGLDTMDACLAP